MVFITGQMQILLKYSQVNRSLWKMGLLLAFFWPELAFSLCRDLIESDFRQVVLVTGLNQAMQMGIAKDNRIFIATKLGEVHLVKPGVMGSALIGKIPVETHGYMGLLALALDPGFPTKPWIYLLYNSSENPFSNFRVSRFAFSGESLELTSEKILLEIPNRDNHQDPQGTHTGGKLAFGLEGSLLITSGDNSQYGDYGQLDDRTAEGTALSTSGNTNHFGGKVLRIKPKDDGTYEIPQGNLFSPGMAMTKPEIYAMGLRNPYSIQVDPEKGWFLVGDVGPQGPKDVSLRGPPGGEEFLIMQAPGNYGWPMFYGANQPYAHYDFASRTIGALYDPLHPINDSKWNTGLKALPPAQPSLIALEKYRPDLTLTGFGTTSQVCISGPLYRYGIANLSKLKFPPQLNGAWFLGDYVDSRIGYVTLDKSGKTFFPKGPIFTNMNFVQIIDMRMGGDGSLYVLEHGGKISRIEYIGPEFTPSQCEIITGCTQASSPNYNLSAQINDGSCQSVATEPKGSPDFKGIRVQFRNDKLFVSHLGAYQILVSKVDGSVLMRLAGQGPKEYSLAKAREENLLLVTITGTHFSTSLKVFSTLHN